MEGRSQECTFCRGRIAVRELITHISTCPNANTCEHCGGRVSLTLFSAHKAVCDRAPVKKARFDNAMRRVECLECGEWMSFQELNTHLNDHEARVSGAVLVSFHKMCSVCHDDFKENQKVYVLKCGHMFHDKCLSQWAEHERTCPNCREPFM